MNSKNPTPADIKAGVDKIGYAFETFKQNNDRSIELSRKGQSDPVLEEKINRISSEVGRLNSALDRMCMSSNRPGLEGKSVANIETREHKSFFYNRFLRKGQDGGLQELEAKALNTGVSAEGGYAVPEELDRTVDRLLKSISPIRQIANVVQIGSSSYRKLVSLSDASSGWVGETDARAQGLEIGEWWGR